MMQVTICIDTITAAVFFVLGFIAGAAVSLWHAFSVVVTRIKKGGIK